MRELTLFILRWGVFPATLIGLSGCFLTDSPLLRGERTRTPVTPPGQRTIRQAVSSALLKKGAQDLGATDPLATFPVLVRLRDNRTPAKYYLYDTDHSFSCLTDDGPVASWRSAFYAERYTPIAYQLGDACYVGNPSPVPSFPMDSVGKHWLSPIINKPLTVYAGRLFWMLESPLRPEQLGKYDTIGWLCDSEDRKMAFVAIRSAGKLWGLVAWEDPDHDPEITSARNYQTTKFFALGEDWRDPAAIRFFTPNGHLKGNILVSQSAEGGTQRAVVAFSEVQGIPEDYKTPSLNCTMGPPGQGSPAPDSLYTSDL